MPTLRYTRGPALAVAALLGACGAELTPAYVATDGWTVVQSGLEGPVRALAQSPNGEIFAFGGPVEGPSFARRLSTGARLAVPSSTRAIDRARFVGTDLWLVAEDGVWSGPFDALGRRDLHAKDVTATASGEALLIGDGLTTIGSDGNLRTLDLIDTASAAPSTGYVRDDGFVWVGGDELLARVEADGQLRHLDHPDGAHFRSFEGSSGWVYVVGEAGERGLVLELGTGATRDIGIGSMPPLYAIRAWGPDQLWVGGEGGFVARLEGPLWTAWEVPFDRVYAVQPSADGRKVWVGGEVSGAGAIGLFAPALD